MNDINEININDALSIGRTTIPNRKYPRAKFHDYNGGDYFVTVCTKNKTHYFGKIYDGVMHLSDLGNIFWVNGEFTPRETMRGKMSLLAYLHALRQ